MRIIALIVGGLASIVGIALMVMSLVIASFSGTRAAETPSASPSASSSGTVTMPGTTASPTPSATFIAACKGNERYLAASEDTLADHAFAPAFDNGDRQTIVDQAVANMKVDPAYTAALSGYLNGKADGTLDDRTESYLDNCGTWSRAITSVTRKLNRLDFSGESVDAGARVLYMYEDGDTYDIRQGYTVDDGTAAVFTDGDTRYRFLLDYGFAPLLSGKAPDVRYVPGSQGKAPSSASDTASGGSGSGNGSSQSSGSSSPSPVQSGGSSGDSDEDYGYYPEDKPPSGAENSAPPVQHSDTSSSSSHSSRSGQGSSSSGSGSASGSSNSSSSSGGTSAGDPGKP